MHPLSQQVDQISSALRGIDTSDLQKLAEVHSYFDALLNSAGETADVDGDVLNAVESLSAEARDLLERLILDETEDALAQVSKVIDITESIRDALETGDIADAVVPDDSVEAAMKTVEAEAGANPAAETPAAPPVEARIFNDDDLPLIQEFITEANGHLESAEAEMLVIEEDPSNSNALGAVFRAFHTIKGVAGFLDLKQIQSLAHVAENLLDRARSGEMQLTGTPADLVLQSIDSMKAMVNAVATAASTRTPLATVAGVDSLVRLLNDCLEGKLVESVAPARKPQAETPAANAEAKPETPAADIAKAAGDGTVKVATDRLDRLIDMVGELVIANSMVAQDIGEHAAGNVRLTKHLGHQGKIVRELQDLSMSLRMVQVGNVFRKMSRLVRDTARKAGKEVELEIEGAETELDRNVVEALGDPLVHMVRNAVDHGIEPAEERVKSGKPRTGKVHLRAFHKGGAVNIEIADDGRGLNKERILKKAIAAGIVREGETLSDQDIYKLIFHAGLSTAEKVTDISGRGVGMDVVKQNIEKLRGRVEINSVPGKGSTFTIRLPLTLAVIDGLVVTVGREKYIVPLNSIEQSLRPTPDMLSTVQGRGEIVTVRGSILPLVRLHRMFNVPPRSEDPANAIVVIVQDNDRRACLLVDELLGQEQVVIKSLGAGMSEIPGVSGGAVLGDGNVSLILDVPGLIETSTK